MIWALIKAFILYVVLRFAFGFCILLGVSMQYPSAKDHPMESLIPLIVEWNHLAFWIALVLSVIYFFKAWD